MIWFGIGLVITIGTYAFAASRGGGTYLVSYGPMVVGVVCMARGGFDVLRQRRAAGSAPGPADGQAMATAPGYGGGYGGGYDGYGTRSGAVPDGGMPGTGTRTSDPSMGGAASRAGAAYAGTGAREQAQGSRENGAWEGFQGGGRQARAGYGQAEQANTMAPQPNWYPDPQHPAMLRWWDGQMWTNHTRPAG
jgi:hypothetical protein